MGVWVTVGAKFPRPPTRRLRLSLASTHNGHVTQNLHILVGIRYGRCFAFLQAISIRFYKAMGSCLYIYIYMCRRYVGECEDIGPSADVFAWVCG